MPFSTDSTVICLPSRFYTPNSSSYIFAEDVEIPGIDEEKTTGASESRVAAAIFALAVVFIVFVIQCMKILFREKEKCKFVFESFLAAG